MAGTPKIRHRVHSCGILKEKLYQKDIHRLLPSKKGRLRRIKEKAERLADLAKEYGVLSRTIYSFLSRSGQNSGALLELAKQGLGF